MERNQSLPLIKDFKNGNHFYIHLQALLKELYPNSLILKNKITFQEPKYIGVSIDIDATSLHPHLGENFRELYPKFKKNGNVFFELINTSFSWTGSTGKGYMYPFDRDMFDDSKLGMEQKAAFFVVILEITLKFLINK